jgi:hypothetical protein
MLRANEQLDRPVAKPRSRRTITLRAPQHENRHADVVQVAGERRDSRRPAHGAEWTHTTTAASALAVMCQL